MNTKWFLLTALFGLLLACSHENTDNAQLSENESYNDATTDELLGSDVALGDMPEYSNDAPGASERFDRSFENAPPLIPHNTEGFFPITAKNNICLTCHMPDKAVVSKAVPLPQSHFTNFRPDIKNENGVYKVQTEQNEVHKESLDHLNTAFYSCNQCHVPQTNNKITLVENNFTPEFRTEMSKRNSNFFDVVEEGVNK